MATFINKSDMNRFFNLKLSASIMCANLLCLEKDLKILETEGIHMIHFDIMDGHFVPNLALSPLLLRWIRPVCSLPIDVHLMVTDPERYFQDLFQQNVDYITIHVETLGSHGTRLFRTIKQHGILAGIAINPLTPIDYLKPLLPYIDKVTVMSVDPGFAGEPFIEAAITKLKLLKQIKNRKKYRFELEVDGSINSATFEKVISAGAEILVVGSSGLFSRHPDLRTAVRGLLNELADICRRMGV